MDIPSLPYQTEVFDAAYSSYVGYMIVEMLHSNAILRAFVHILDGFPKNVQTDKKRVPKQNSPKIPISLRNRLYGSEWWTS